MALWSSTTELIKAQAAILGSNNHTTMRGALDAWCIKSTEASTTSHKALRDFLKTYKPITELVHAALILKNLDPRFIAICAKFMGQ